MTDGSDLHYVQFRALDEESIDKDWAWLAFAEDAEEQKDSINVVRIKVGHEIYDTTMLALSAGSPDIDSLSAGGPGADSLLGAREYYNDHIHERRL